MAHSDVVAAIEAHVRSAFHHCEVFGEGQESEVPADGGTFLLVEFPYANSEQRTIGSPGSNYWREEGAFTITLAVSRGIALRQSRLWLDDLAKTFRGRDIGPVRCAAPQPPVLDDDRGDHAHVRLMMAVPYTFDLEG